MTLHPIYLTIVPLFHCNNWCHVWTMPAVGGTTVCCRDIGAKVIYDAIADEGRDASGRGPIVLNIDRQRQGRGSARLRFTSSRSSPHGAPRPLPPATLAAIETMGLNNHAGLRADENLRAGHRMHLTGRGIGTALEGRGARQREGAGGRADAQPWTTSP